MLIGAVSEFTLDEDWQLWYDRLDMYFYSNEVEALRQPAMFLKLLDKDGYALLHNLLFPIKPHEVTLKDMVAPLQKHLQPIPSVILERYKFKECRQKEGNFWHAYRRLRSTVSLTRAWIVYLEINSYRAC